MTPSALVLVFLGVAVVLLATQWMRAELVALLALFGLAIGGVLSRSDALAGFSNPAVVTIAAVLVLSGGLTRTGVAALVGQQVLRLAGGSELRLLVLMMATAGLLSGVINGIAVIALMLPVVVDITRRLDRPASKLLIPLAFASLLGGMTTLIGGSPNLLVSGALDDHGLRPFGVFDFTPVGLTALLVGIVYVAVAGRRLLPDRDRERHAGKSSGDLTGLYHLERCLISLTVRPGSPLAGRTLAQSLLGSALGFTVLAIVRSAETVLAPEPGTVLVGGDRLLVEGRLDQFEALRGWSELSEATALPDTERLLAAESQLALLRVAVDSPLAARTLLDNDLRRHHHINVLLIDRDGEIFPAPPPDTRLNSGDELLVLGEPEQIARLGDTPEFSSNRSISGQEAATLYWLPKYLRALRVPPSSLLDGKSLLESHLGDAFGLTLLAIERGAQTLMPPEPESQLRAGDALIVLGSPEAISTLQGLQSLGVEEGAEADLEALESERIGLAEVMLSPGSSAAGKTLGELYFRDKYGLSVVALWRGDRAHHSGLRDMTLRLGDALLVYGRRARIAMLAREPDFLALKDTSDDTYRTARAPIAAAIEGGVLLTATLGWLPIYIAAPTGAIAMILSGCLSMEEACRSIEWKVVLLIAGMLSLSLALEQSGAAGFLAHNLLGSIASFGSLALIAGLFLITTLAAQAMPAAAVAVLMSPIALETASELGVSPYCLMMVVAVGSCTGFLSPVGHPGNLLVMGVGGYRFSDYARIGLPLVLLTLLVVMFVLPVFWPLYP